MIQIKCPVCGTVIEVSLAKQQVFCPKCIKTGTQIVMLETSETQFKNLGDGLFTKE